LEGKVREVKRSALEVKLSASMQACKRASVQAECRGLRLASKEERSGNGAEPELPKAAREARSPKSTRAVR